MFAFSTSVIAATSCTPSTKTAAPPSDQSDITHAPPAVHIPAALYGGPPIDDAPDGGHPTPTTSVPTPPYKIGDAALAVMATMIDLKCPKTAAVAVSRIVVTFAIDGTVADAKVKGPIEGTTAAACFENGMRAARMPAFRGEPQAIAFELGVK
jgi:hypothetical protein